MATNLETNGYTYSVGGYTFYVFINAQLTQEILTQLQNFVPGWLPNSTQGFLTICADNGQGQVGIYQVDHVMNLFAICPKFMHDVSHLRGHMTGIFNYIHELIKSWTNVHIANEIRYKLAFYKPVEIQQVPYNDWPGNWKYTKNTARNICNTMYPRELEEYAVRWSFDDTFQVKTATQTQWNLGWNTSTTTAPNPNNPLNRWSWNK